MRGLIVLVACIWCSSCLFWTDVVDTLPGSGLVDWCLESVFFARTQLQILSRTHCQLGIDRGDSAPISAVEACLENSPSSLHFLFFCNFYTRGCLEACFEACRQAHPEDCFFAPSSHGREPELQQRMQMPFLRLAESALFCANFAVAPADLICLACAILLAVTV